jgi:predicted nucleotidyltransferase
MGAERLALFGSLTRNEAGADSDSDVLIGIVPDRPFSLWAVGEVRVRLSEIVGRPVDLPIESDLARELRRRIAPDLARSSDGAACDWPAKGHGCGATNFSGSPLRTPAPGGSLCSLMCVPRCILVEKLRFFFSGPWRP